MFSSFLTVAGQVGILFTLMMVGYICRVTKILTDKSMREIVELLALIVAPALIIHCFQRPFNPENLTGLGWAFGTSVLSHLLGAILAIICIRTSNKSRESVLRFSVIFSNGGFMALPLEYALFGKDGVFYGAVYVVLFNLICWSYGIIVMRGTMKEVGWYSLLVNPGSIGIALGLPFFLFSWTLPPILAQPISMIADLNTPLAMIVLGFYLGGVDFCPFYTSLQAYIALILRLLILPLLMIGVFLLLKPHDKTMALAIITSSAAPAAALTAMLAARYKRDIGIGVSIVAVTTLLSILTMPLVVGFAMSIIR